MVAKKQLQVEKLEVVELADEFAVCVIYGDDRIMGCSTTDEYLSRHYDDATIGCDCCDGCGCL